jgi:hypothetical protein
MSHTPVLQQSTTRKVYRIGLYGRRNSGKTCILAALAMPREKNPEGLTCDWLGMPPGMARPAGDPRTWSTGDPPTAFALGQDWLNRAIRALEQQVVPPPNPNDRDALRFHYEFKATEEGRPFLVELIDYSGELIDPDLSESDLARRLREHLLTMDGILILAEAPHRNQHLAQLYVELQRLTRAFAILRAEKSDGPLFNIPVGILVNKWDRQTALSTFSTEAGRREVEELLASQPQPPHCTLVDNVRGAVTKGNFDFFAVSAFGKHVLNGSAGVAADGSPEMERPAHVNPLCSFGLEDGFVWVCRRRDGIDIEDLKGQAATRVGWKVWQLAQHRTRRQIRERSEALAGRFPSGSVEQRRVSEIGGMARKAFWAQVAWLFLVIALLAAGVEAVVDDHSYRLALTTLNNPQEADQAALDRCERWLENYYQAPFFQHVVYSTFFLSKSAAKDRLEERRGDLVARHWEIVKGMRDDREAQARAAQAMLDRFPNSEQAPELKRIIEEWKEEERRKRIQFEAEYHDCMRKGNFCMAAQRLVEWKADAAGLKKLKKEFVQQVRPALARKKNELVSDRQWARARGELHTVRNDTYVKELLPEDELRKIDDLLDDVDVREDQYLYGLVQNRKTRTYETIQRYLTDAPLKGMRKHVEDMRDHLKKMEGPLARIFHEGVSAAILCPGQALGKGYSYLWRA